MQTFATPGPITVVIDVNVADVQITASDRTDTRVEIRPTNRARKTDVTVAEQTTVDYADGRLRVSGPRGWRQWMRTASRESIDVEIDLPSGSNLRTSAGVAALRGTGRLGECRYESGIGDFSVEESGPVSVAIGSGDIEIGHAIGDVDVKTSGRVQLGTVDGAVVVKNSNGDTSIHDVVGDLRVSSANGEIVVERARATVAAKSANGNVRIEHAERGSVVAETARGKVEVGIRDGVAVWLDLNTAFGTVTNELDATGAPAPGESSVEVRARTAFGDITIRRVLAGSHPSGEG
jgi:DUF4097 and DUF4098 domain-containing protein YvlB